MKKAVKVSRRVINLEYKDAPGKNVRVAGSFNDWQPVKEMKDKNNDIFSRSIFVFQIDDPP